MSSEHFPIQTIGSKKTIQCFLQFLGLCDTTWTNAPVSCFLVKLGCAGTRLFETETYTHSESLLVSPLSSPLMCPLPLTDKSKVPCNRYLSLHDPSLPSKAFILLETLKDSAKKNWKKEWEYKYLFVWRDLRLLQMNVNINFTLPVIIPSSVPQRLKNHLSSKRRSVWGSRQTKVTSLCINLHSVSEVKMWKQYNPQNTMASYNNPLNLY